LNSLEKKEQKKIFLVTEGGEEKKNDRRRGSPLRHTGRHLHGGFAVQKGRRRTASLNEKRERGGGRRSERKSDPSHSERMRRYHKEKRKRKFGREKKKGLSRTAGGEVN